MCHITICELYILMKLSVISVKTSNVSVLFSFKADLLRGKSY